MPGDPILNSVPVRGERRRRRRRAGRSRGLGEPWSGSESVAKQASSAVDALVQEVGRLVRVATEKDGDNGELDNGPAGQSPVREAGRRGEECVCVCEGAPGPKRAGRRPTWRASGEEAEMGSGRAGHDGDRRWACWQRRRGKKGRGRDGEGGRQWAGSRTEGSRAGAWARAAGCGLFIDGDSRAMRTRRQRGCVEIASGRGGVQ